MGNLIQICGLPRSGTGFLSVLLALNPSCISYHELISKKDNYKQILEKGLLEYDFVADCSTYGFYPNHSYPESKKVLIRRDIYSSMESCEKIFRVSVDIVEYIKHTEVMCQWVSYNEVLEIEYEDLFRIETLENIWIHCFGSKNGFIQEKVNNLLDMNIQMQYPRNVIEDSKTIARVKNQLNLELCQ